MKKKKILTNAQAKNLNLKIGIIQKEIHSILDNHGFHDLQVNAIHLTPSGTHRYCTCENGEEGILVCDEETGICRCDCS